MTIKKIARNIDLYKLMNILSLNEISNNEELIYKFSYAGGISGYSFGRSQFDVSHNLEAREFLEKYCDFSKEDITRLLNLDKNILDLNEKLKEHKKEIDFFDLIHVKKMVNYITNLNDMPDIENEKCFVQLVDYHNQFNLSKNGPMHKFLKSLETVSSKQILEFKLNLKWGKTHPNDVMRRYNNIENNW